MSKPCSLNKPYLISFEFFHLWLKMLSNAEYNLLRKLSSLASMSNFLPLKLQNRYLIYWEPKRRKIFGFCKCFLQLFHFIIIIFQLRSDSKAKDYSSLVIGGMFLISIGFTFVMNITLRFRGKEYCALINSISNLQQLYSNSRTQEHFICPNNIRELIFYLVPYNLFFVHIFYMLLDLYYTFTPFWSFELMGKGETFLLIVFYSACKGIHYLHSLIHVNLLVDTFLASLFSIKYLIRGSASECEKNIGKSIRIHIKAYILNNLSNLAFGSFFIPFINLATYFALLITLYGTIRLVKVLDLFSYVFICLSLIAAASILAPIAIEMSSVYFKSEQYLVKSQKIIGLTNNHVLTHILRSCGVIRSVVGFFYYMEGKAKLTLADSVINGIVFVLLN